MSVNGETEDFEGVESDGITGDSMGKVYSENHKLRIELEKVSAELNTRKRELEIEAALEKVRATAMATHKSMDLRSVVQILYDQLRDLGFQSGVASITIMDPDTGDIDWWMEGYEDGYALPERYHVSFFDHLGHQQQLAHWKSGTSFAEIEISGQEKKTYDAYYFFKTDFALAPESSKQLMMQQESVRFSMAYMKYGALSWSPSSLSQDQKRVLERFAKVFEQCYTRFLDLQKAEKQAREAQIEAALEKVRSRTMAMQKSEELADAAYVLFEQLNILAVTHERINIGIVDEANQQIDFWVTEQGGQKLQTKFSGRISEPTTLSKSYEAWKNGAKSLVVDLQGEELQNWLRYLEEEIKIPFNKVYLHTRRVQTAGFFSKGMLVVTSPEPLQQEALYLLEKFANVFDLTYTRFNDLLRAEAQAIRAKENLIAIQAAKSKAEEALTELKATQTQLVQQEKLASLGQLTAGIAHEIKNPLNFVNNFSEVSIELVDDAIEERSKSQEARDENLVDEILVDIKSNLQKVHEHGTRANGIVSSMLQHSRGGSGKMEPTDLNALIKEYVNLSFHGMRAGKNPIDVDIVLELEPEIGEVSLIKEDFTRVIINLCNNAFDAMRGKKYQVQSTKYQEVGGNGLDYLPKMLVSTILENGQVRISFEDNGPGIPDDIKDKILQPFFTTKKGTEGTGLGLSITHDIVKAHGGELKVETKEGQFSQFIISLPL